MLSTLASCTSLLVLLAAKATRASQTHCEQSFGVFDTTVSLVSVQELQSPPGPRHSDGIVATAGDPNQGTSLGFVYFSNDLVNKDNGSPMGKQSGHCIQVYNNEQLACYFNFDIEQSGGPSGRITAEALFNLPEFPDANLVITGGTGDFHGIVGDGCTEDIDAANGTFLYNFQYKIMTPTPALPSSQVEQLPDHCEQTTGPGMKFLSVQELQSPAGPRHSDGIVATAGDPDQGTSLGFVYFSNDLVEPLHGDPMGTQSGHCIQVHNGVQLACYFNFDIQQANGLSGRITAEALFDLENFPNANLVITGGTGDFRGITGSGCTKDVDAANGTFLYNFSYKLASTIPSSAMIPAYDGLPQHCEQRVQPGMQVLRIQELQSPPGARHSDGIVPTAGDPDQGTSLGYVYFHNDIVDPTSSEPMGTQSGHCIQVHNGVQLACYFNFRIKQANGHYGRLTAEALFDLGNFPAANLVITGGTGEFRGIVGSGCTEDVDAANGTFIYNFVYQFASTEPESCAALKQCCGEDCCGQDTSWDVGSSRCILNYGSSGFDGTHYYMSDFDCKPPGQWPCCEEDCCAQDLYYEVGSGFCRPKP